MSTQFTWWRRFYSTQKLNPKEMYKGASKLLQRIEAGEFEHDGLWEQSYLEDAILDYTMNEFVEKNPGVSQDLYEKVYVDNRKKKSKRVGIMRENHLKNEINMLYNLKNELAKEFGIEDDIVWNFIEEFDGTTRELYFAVKDLANGKPIRSSEDIAKIPRLINQQPRHILKRANLKYLPLWRKIILKYNLHFAYPYE